MVAKVDSRWKNEMRDFGVAEMRATVEGKRVVPMSANGLSGWRSGVTVAMAVPVVFEMVENVLWEGQQGGEDTKVDVMSKVGPGTQENDEVGDYNRRLDVVE
jgi:hypothetical protein